MRGNLTAANAADRWLDAGAANNPRGAARVRAYVARNLRAVAADPRGAAALAERPGERDLAALICDRQVLANGVDIGRVVAAWGAAAWPARRGGVERLLVGGYVCWADVTAAEVEAFCGEGVVGKSEGLADAVREVARKAREQVVEPWSGVDHGNVFLIDVSNLVGGQLFGMEEKVYMIRQGYLFEAKIGMPRTVGPRKGLKLSLRMLRATTGFTHSGRVLRELIVKARFWVDVDGERFRDSGSREVDAVAVQGTFGTDMLVRGAGELASLAGARSIFVGLRVHLLRTRTMCDLVDWELGQGLCRCEKCELADAICQCGCKVCDGRAETKDECGCPVCFPEPRAIRKREPIVRETVRYVDKEVNVCCCGRGAACTGSCACKTGGGSPASVITVGGGGSVVVPACICPKCKPPVSKPAEPVVDSKCCQCEACKAKVAAACGCCDCVKAREGKKKKDAAALCCQCGTCRPKECECCYCVKARKEKKEAETKCCQCEACKPKGKDCKCCECVNQRAEKKKVEDAKCCDCEKCKPKECQCCDCVKARKKKEEEKKEAEKCSCEACKPKEELSCEAMYRYRYDSHGSRYRYLYDDGKCECKVCEAKVKKPAKKKECLVCGGGVKNNDCMCFNCEAARKKAKSEEEKKKKNADKRCIVCGLKHGEVREVGCRHCGAKSHKKPKPAKATKSVKAAKSVAKSSKSHAPSSKSKAGCRCSKCMAKASRHSSKTVIVNV